MALAETSIRIAKTTRSAENHEATAIPAIEMVLQSRAGGSDDDDCSEYMLESIFLGHDYESMIFKANWMFYFNLFRWRLIPYQVPCGPGSV